MSDSQNIEILELNKKRVLITGGSRGIGRACVKTFIKHGAEVVFTYKNDHSSANNLVKWAKDQSSEIFSLQTDSEDLKSYPYLYDFVFSRLGGLDILVNNVGDAICRKTFVESDDELWTKALALNLLSSVRATRALLPLLLKNESAVIINISSIAATTTGAGDSLHYGVAKAALNTFTIGLAKELSGTSVRSLGLAPSAIDTEFQKRHSSEDRINKIIKETPCGRMGYPDEIAWLVALLASPKSSYVNGTVLSVTGGR